MFRLMSGTDLDLLALQDGTFSEQYKLFGLIPLKVEKLDQISIEPFEFEGNPCFTVKLFGIPMATYNKIKPVPVPECWIKDFSQKPGTFYFNSGKS